MLPTPMHWNPLADRNSCKSDRVLFYSTFLGDVQETSVGAKLRENPFPSIFQNSALFSVIGIHPIAATFSKMHVSPYAHSVETQTYLYFCGCSYFYYKSSCSKSMHSSPRLQEWMKSGPMELPLDRFLVYFSVTGRLASQRIRFYLFFFWARFSNLMGFFRGIIALAFFQRGVQISERGHFLGKILVKFRFFPGGRLSISKCFLTRRECFFQSLEEQFREGNIFIFFFF